MYSWFPAIASTQQISTVVSSLGFRSDAISLSGQDRTPCAQRPLTPDGQTFSAGAALFLSFMSFQEGRLIAEPRICVKTAVNFPFQQGQDSADRRGHRPASAESC